MFYYRLNYMVLWNCNLLMKTYGTMKNSMALCKNYGTISPSMELLFMIENNMGDNQKQ